MPANWLNAIPEGKMRGPRTRALLDRFGEPIGTAGIADRCEAALQHPFEHLRRLQGQQGDRPVREAGERGIDGQHMDMRIDQSGIRCGMEINRPRLWRW
jgi:hypothetical protein